MSGDKLRNPEQELTLEMTEASLDMRKNKKDEVSTRTLTGSIDLIVTTLAMSLSLYALYWVVGIIQPQIYRVSFLLITLVLIFLIFPYILLFSLLPLLSAGVRRFHDMNKSGWTVMYAMIPIIGAFIVLGMLLGDGTKGKNTFGPKPKK